MKYLFIYEITPELLLALERLFRLTQPTRIWNAEKMAKAIASSTFTFITVEQGEIIGFARVISDGVYRATIWDILVHPSHHIFDETIKMILRHPMLRKVERSYIINEDNYLSSEYLIGEINPSATMGLKR